MHLHNFLPKSIHQTTHVTIIAFVITATLLTIPNTTRAQCYTDPYTGQRICNRQITPCAPITAQPTVDPTSHCRITISDGTMGSGSLVATNDDLGLVLTCSHLFNNCQTGIVVTFSNGRRFAANLVELDRANDLAALTIRRPDVASLTVSDSNPTGTLTACGFGPNGVFRNITGRITGQAIAAGATFPSTTIAGAVRPGDSGGAVLNAAYQVVGVVWGQQSGQTYATCGQPVRDFLARIKNKVFAPPTIAAKPINSQPPAQPGVHSPSLDWQTWTAELDARLRALDAKKQDRGDYLQPGDLNRYIKTDDATKITDNLTTRAELETRLKDVTTKFESVHNTVESVRHSIDQLAAARTGILEGVSIGKVAVATLGLSGPLAAAVILASGLAGRRLKSKVERQATVSPSLPTPNSTLPTTPIAIDTPPPPQRTVPETHYVPIEKDTFAKAHQWASEHVARKYPGATEVLQTQDSLIKQFLAAK